MHIILGGTGHIGKALCKELLEQGEDLLIVTHNPDNITKIKAMGADVAVTDVLDTNRLQGIIKRGKRLYLLNPPAAPYTDTVAEERKRLESILAAIEGCTLERIVAESTYGAQPGDAIGDLGVLYDMEVVLKAAPFPVTIIRGAYYYSNWDASLETAKSEGKVYSLYPPDFMLPMVAPADIGKFAAKLMVEKGITSNLHYIEGPVTYSANDVAALFAKALNKPVRVVEIPKEEWNGYLIKAGFSEAAAQSMANMTEITLEQKYDLPNAPERGTTTLDAYINTLVDAANAEVK
jgi:uncharacterized protein YbjT (DUF2867 family)